VAIGSKKKAGTFIPATLSLVAGAQYGGGQTMVGSDPCYALGNVLLRSVDRECQCDKSLAQEGAGRTVSNSSTPAAFPGGTPSSSRSLERPTNNVTRLPIGYLVQSGPAKRAK